VNHPGTSPLKAATLILGVALLLAGEKTDSRPETGPRAPPGGQEARVSSLPGEDWT